MVMRVVSGKKDSLPEKLFLKSQTLFRAIRSIENERMSQNSWAVGTPASAVREKMGADHDQGTG